MEQSRKWFPRRIDQGRKMVRINKRPNRGLFRMDAQALLRLKHQFLTSVD